MKIEMGKKYKTRDGKKVRIYAVDGVDAYCVHGAFFTNSKHSKDGWSARCWRSNGKVYAYDTCNLDLTEDKEDFEIAKELLGTKSAVLIKINGDIFPIKSIEIHEDAITIGVYYEEYYMRFEKMKKSDFKLATKEEVIEYFFGSENEN